MPAVAQSASERGSSDSTSVAHVCGPAPVISLAGSEPPAKIYIDPTLAEPLPSRGVVIIQYCAQNLHIVPVFGPDAPRRFDWGARTVCIMAALWPERCKAMVSVSGYLIGSQTAGKMPLPPQNELQWWYQYYFATERGKRGYKIALPKWRFDDATFERSAASFNNPDHVDIVIHNYRWRLVLAEGEAKYDELEKRLAEAPVIMVPAITLEGDANGAPHPDSSAYAKKFSGKYSHWLITGGIGHNLPQEAPQAFAKAVVDVDVY